MEKPERIARHRQRNREKKRQRKPKRMRGRERGFPLPQPNQGTPLCVARAVSNVVFISIQVRNSYAYFVAILLAVPLSPGEDAFVILLAQTIMRLPQLIWVASWEPFSTRPLACVRLSIDVEWEWLPLETEMRLLPKSSQLLLATLDRS